VPHTSATCRRLRRYWPLKTATVACSRGPKAPAGTSGGSVARVARPQAGHVTRCSRCSVTSARTTGSSVTWCGQESPAGSGPGNGAAQCAQVVGPWSTIWSTRSGGTSPRWCATCPGCPPRARPLGGAAGRRGACGGSLDGGRDEFEESCPNRALSSPTSAAKLTTCCVKATITAWASSGKRSHSARATTGRPSTPSGTSTLNRTRHPSILRHRPPLGYTP